MDAGLSSSAWARSSVWAAAPDLPTASTRNGKSRSRVQSSRSRVQKSRVPGMCLPAGFEFCLPPPQQRPLPSIEQSIKTDSEDTSDVKVKVEVKAEQEEKPKIVSMAIEGPSEMKAEIKDEFKSKVEEIFEEPPRQLITSVPEGVQLLAPRTYQRVRFVEPEIIGVSERSWATLRASRWAE